MALAVQLLGDPGRQPFAGHVAFVRDVGGVVLSAAARVAAREGLVAAPRAARSLAEALIEAHQLARGPDRHQVLRAIWTRLADLDRDLLGAERGRDLSLLLHVRDARGEGIAAVGLGALIDLRPEGPVELVVPGHPLLGPPGLPEGVPGVFTPDVPVHRLLGCPAHLEGPLPEGGELRRRLGVDP